MIHPPINLNKNRIEVFDIAKGLGILIVVMGHCGFGVGFDKLIQTFHMPLFFFISGYFYRPEKSKNFKEYFFHQINVLIVPYIVFAIIYGILHYIYTSDFSIHYFIKSLLSSNHNRIDVEGALWFLLSLFCAKIIYCLLERNIKSIINLTLVVTLISFVAFTFRRFGLILPLGLDSAMSMLIVIHSGYILYVYRGKKILQRLSTLSPTIVILLIILFFVTGYYNGPVLVRRNRYGIEVLYMISCFCGIILTMNISHYICKWDNKITLLIKKVISFWGRESIVFLLINETSLFIIGELFVALGASRSLVSQNYWIRGLIVLGAMGIMSLVALFSRKKPFSYILGKTPMFKHHK